jgi:flagellar motility protein MotE (MotC chaperone)
MLPQVDQQRIIILLVVSSITLFGLLAGVVYLSKTHPEYIGLPKIRVAQQIDSTAKYQKTLLGSKKKVYDEFYTSLKIPTVNWQDSVELYKKLNSNALAKIDTLTKSSVANINLLSKTQDSLTYANLVAFAKVYEKASPTEVAKILEEIDIRDAATILKLMKKKSAASVVNQMNPVRSAAIIQLGVTPSL